MTADNIIELTPFRADLTRALARRGERLLAAPDLAAEVADLEPLEAYYIVREIGLDLALPILLALRPEQLEVCIDLDCWHRSDFGPERLDEWLAAFALAEPTAMAKAFFSLDLVVQLLYLAQTVTVYDPDTDEVAPADEERRMVRAITPDGFFLLELRTELDLKIHPFAVLDALYQVDASAAFQLLSDIRVDLPMQIEEEALRFRNGRLQDLGFGGPDEAAVLFSRPSQRQPAPRLGQNLDRNLRVPAVYAAPLQETSLLQRALSLITDRQSLARLEQELVCTINSAIIGYGEKTREISQITDITERVRDTVSLGLEVLLAAEEGSCSPPTAATAAQAAELLAVWSIAELFRHGFGATLVLQKEAHQALAAPGFRAWYDLPDSQQSDEPTDRLDRAFVAALLGRHPLRGGVASAKAEEVKAFTCRAEINGALARLHRLVARLGRQA
jgi:hypothetical protein